MDSRYGDYFPGYCNYFGGYLILRKLMYGMNNCGKLFLYEINNCMIYVGGFK